ncbi:MAG: hypothetical protein NTU79_14495 [Planctomycetota bacterium]|nr:hypothetical protein [Planctomycetota bacterium]
MNASVRFASVFLLAIPCALLGYFGLLTANATQQGGALVPATASTPQSQPPTPSEGKGKGKAKKRDAVVPIPTVEWEAPKNGQPAWLQRSVEDELSIKMEQAIRDRLNQRLDVSFTAQPLSAVMKFFSQELKIPILIDDKALEEENITPDEPITFELDNIRAVNALELILRPLQLTYVVGNEVMMITSKRTAANITRYYDLSTILPDNSLSGEIVELIQEMVASDTWQVSGGVSKLRMFGSVLVVNAPEETHLAIAELIRAIANQPKSNMKPRIMPKDLYQPSAPGGMGGGPF